MNSTEKFEVIASAKGSSKLGNLRLFQRLQAQLEHLQLFQRVWIQFEDLQSPSI